MRAWLFIIAALAIASCGGGEAPVQGNNALVDELQTASPQSREFTEDEKFANDRFKELKLLLAEAEENHPGIADYDRLVAQSRSENDGGGRFHELVRPAGALSILEGDEPWRHLLNIGGDGFEEKYGRKPRDSDREEALAQTNWIPGACRELLAFESVVALAYVDDDKDLAMSTLSFCSIPPQRARLLLSMNKPVQAGRELAEFLELASRLDTHTSWWSKATRQGIVWTILYRLIAGELGPLAENPSVVEAMNALRSDPSTDFRRQWHADLTRGLWWIKRAETAEEYWAEDEPDVETIEHFRFMLAAYETFPDGAPNPFNPASYDEAKLLAKEHGGQAAVKQFAALADLDMRTECMWLAWELCQMDKIEPLITRKEPAVEKIALQPWCKAKWKGNELELSIDATHPVTRDGYLKADRRDVPVITIPLREPPAEEERQPD